VLLNYADQRLTTFFIVCCFVKVGEATALGEAERELKSKDFEYQVDIKMLKYDFLNIPPSFCASFN
jgi:hypothetical protein